MQRNVKNLTYFRLFEQCLCLLHHLLQLGIGGLFLAGKFEKLLKVTLRLFIVWKVIIGGIGDIIIGGDGIGIIFQVFLPGFHSFGMVK